MTRSIHDQELRLLRVIWTIEETGGAGVSSADAAPVARSEAKTTLRSSDLGIIILAL